MTIVSHSVPAKHKRPRVAVLGGHDRNQQEEIDEHDRPRLYRIKL